jgi:hypothetical protein
MRFSVYDHSGLMVAKTRYVWDAVRLLGPLGPRATIKCDSRVVWGKQDTLDTSNPNHIPAAVALIGARVRAHQLDRLARLG